MNTAFLMLLVSTFAVGIVHTLTGPDHYLPFIALSRNGNWTMKKTVLITALCGFGHIASAVVLGFFALRAGRMFPQLEAIESFRGKAAAWMLIGAGLAYALWGLRRALGKKTGRDELPNQEKSEGTRTPVITWTVFVIFVLGPCEPLIPFMLHPLAHNSFLSMMQLVLTFGVATLLSMLVVVMTTVFGIKKLLRFPVLDRFGALISGGVLCSCGLAMTFLGL